MTYQPAETVVPGGVPRPAEPARDEPHYPPAANRRAREKGGVMSSVVIQYNSPLPSCANLREHWRARAKRVQSQRHTARAHVFNALQMSHVNCRGCDAGPKFPLVVTLCRISARALDDDNLASAFKAIRDQVADELGIKDNDPRVSWRYEQRKGASKQQAIEIRIEAREPKAA